MSTYTIVRSDNVVYVDKKAKSVDCSSLPDYFHALQWYGEGQPAPYGEIEYAADATGKRMPNTRFSDFAPYQAYVDAWYAVPEPNLNNPDAPADDTAKAARRKG